MTIVQDLKYAARAFAKAPGFTAVVVVSIALGIAANTTVFSIVNGLLLGSLPVREPDRLAGFAEGRTFSYPDYQDYRDGTAEVFEGVSAAFPLIPVSIGGRGEAERSWGQCTTANYFKVVGVEPFLGRGFLDDEDKATGKNPVVVLSHGLWQNRFNSDRNAIGQQLVLNGASYTIVGVAPRGFLGTARAIIPAFWVPVSMATSLMPDMNREKAIYVARNSQWLMIDARLKPRVTREQAAAAVNVIRQRIDDAHPRGGDRKRPTITLAESGGLPDGASKGVMGLLLVLMIVVGLVLLIACANVANLLLARATARRKEIGIRLAVGAGRGRLIRQLLTESVFLAAISAAIAACLTWFAARALSIFEIPLPLPIAFNFTPDLRVFGFTALLALITGIVFGLAPAVRSTRPDLVSTLKDDGGSLGAFRRFGMRNALVVLQVSLSLVLLVGAVLFLRSLSNATSIDLGFKPDHVVMMAVDPKSHNYSPEKMRQFVSQLRERVTALPGVTSVTFLDSLPLSLGGHSEGFKAEGVKDARQLDTDVYTVGAGFFHTLGVPLVRGRDFDRLRDPAATAIVNEEMAKNLFGSENPLGRRMTGDDKVTYEIVGIAKNSKSRTLGEQQGNIAYLFLEAAPEKIMSFFGISVVARTSVPPRRMAMPIREQIKALDPHLAVFATGTLDEHVNKSLLIPKVCATLLGIFGAIGLVLATVGLYGVMSYGVRSRTREIGIRMALGANAGSVLRMVAMQGVALAAVGLVIGLGLALVLSRFAASLLYGVGATDVFTFVVVPVTLAIVAALAVLIPAFRAAKVDPMLALRYE
jgi:predicted permease